LSWPANSPGVQVSPKRPPSPLALARDADIRPDR
jgi:hypothetical protein